MIEYKRLAKKRRKKRVIIILGIMLLVLCLLAAAFFLCTVRKIEVVGNDHYSDQQIEDLVLPTRWDYNTLYLLYKTRYMDIETPLFLDMVEIEVLSYNSIRIQVYEKTIMGYVEYLGNYVYFDKDGIVLETSNKLKEGLPVVKGLQFDKLIMYEKLPVEDESIFKTLVSLTQMLKKNELNPDCIEFTDNGEIDLTFGEVLVHLGKDAHMGNKIARLTGILPHLEGRSGILFMEDVDESTERITFRKTLSQAEQQAARQAALEGSWEDEDLDETIDEYYDENGSYEDDWEDGYSEDEGSGYDEEDDIEDDGSSEDDGEDYTEDEYDEDDGEEDYEE